MFWLVLVLSLLAFVRYCPRRGIVYEKTEMVRYIVNMSLFLYGLFVCSCLGLGIGILATFDSRPPSRYCVNARVARSFEFYCKHVIGWRFDISGKHHLNLIKNTRQSAVFVGNHQSTYLGAVFPEYCSIMAKKEVKNLPLLGQWMQLSGTIFIDRKNRTSALDSFDKVDKVMKAQKTSLWVFPEGTRSLGPENKLLPFKLGAFHCAMQAKVPIVPIVCQNYFHLYNGKTRFNRGALSIRVLEPIHTTDYGDVHELAEAVRQKMLQALQ